MKSVARLTKADRRPTGKMRRKLRMENLEERDLLATDCVSLPLDTNLDRFVSPVDVLVLVNAVNEAGGNHPDDVFSHPGFNHDVDRDGFTTVYDIDLVVQDIDANGSHPVILECEESSSASLDVTVLDIGSFDTAVENQKDVPFLAFNLSTLGSQDILFTGLDIVQTLGDETFSSLANITLSVDTDSDGKADTILESGVSDGNFHDLVAGGYVVIPGVPTRFEVHADIASSVVGGSIVNIEILGVDGELLSDGSSLTGGIHYTGSNDLQTTIWNEGLLSLNNAYPLPDGYLLAGQTSNDVLAFKFSAIDEPADVNVIAFDALGSDAVSVDYIEILDSNDTVIAHATAGAADSLGGEFDFAALMFSRQLVVGDGETETFTARYQLKRDTAGAVRNEEIQIQLADVSAIGDISGNDLYVSNFNPPTSRQQTVVFANVGSVINANADPAGAAIPTGISTVAVVGLSALPHNNSDSGDDDVIVDKVVIRAEVENVLIGGWEIYNAANSTITYESTLVEVVNPTTRRIHFIGLDSSAVDTEINDGEDLTLRVRANITNPQVDPALTSRVDVVFENDSVDWLDRDGSGDARHQGLLVGESNITNVIIGSYRS